MILFFAGVFLAGDVSLWNLSFSYTSVANANLLCNLTPFTVIPISYLLFKEKVPMSFLLSACITFIGVLVLLDGKASPNPDNFFGDFLAVCASVFYAGFILIAYKLRDKYESSVIMLVSGLGSVVTLFCTSWYCNCYSWCIHGSGTIYPKGKGKHFCSVIRRMKLL